MKRNQTGSVLAISLVLLTAITLISMMGLQRSALQAKIVANIDYKERLFRSCNNDQENRYDSANPTAEAEVKDEWFLDAINKFNVDSLGIKVYEPLDLTLIDDQPSYNQGMLIQPKITSTSIYVPNPPGSNKITLAVGQDNGSHTNHYFTIDCSTSFPNKPSVKSEQVTGFHFPSLIIGQNSL